MAFAAALRRSVTLAAHAIGASRHGYRSAALLRPLPMRSIVSKELRGERTALPFAPFAHFSALAKKPAADADLLKVIEAEIKCAQECDDHDRVEEIPKGFPFEIEDEKGMNIITLRRSYQGEDIEVVVSMPSIVSGEEPEVDRGVNDDDEDEDHNEKPSQSSMPLTVNVSKGEGPGLEFTCTAYPDEVVIDAMTVTEKQGTDEEMIAYDGPPFSDLDENLQKGFHKYLELRGISAMTTNFLQEYMINKDSREYLLWLKNLKQFVQK